MSKTHIWSFHCGAEETNPTSIHKNAGLIPGLPLWVRDPKLLWLWCRLATVALIQFLAWELPYAAGVVLKSQKKKGDFFFFP